MRILCAADVHPDPNSGASGTEYQTISAMRRLGNEVNAIWADDLPHNYRHGNFHYFLELPKGFRDAVRRKWNQNTYDVIHVNQPHAYLAAVDHKRKGRPGIFVNRSHGWESRVRKALQPWRRVYGQPEWNFSRSIPGKVLQKFLSRHERLVTRYSDGVIVSCTECRDYLLEEFCLDPYQVANIHQAPPESYRHTPSAPMIAERMKRILYVGQFAFFKGPVIVADIYNNLSELLTGVELTWVCAKEHHAPARALLTPRAAERTRFLEWQDQEALLRWYDYHGIFIFPSFVEGFGKAILEAMARGLCVIASMTGGAKDIITHGTDGLLVPVGQTKAFCDAVLSLVENYQRASTMAEAARETSCRYSWDRVAKETIYFYEALLLRRERR